MCLYSVSLRSRARNEYLANNVVNVRLQSDGLNFILDIDEILKFISEINFVTEIRFRLVGNIFEGNSKVRRYFYSYLGSSVVSDIGFKALCVGHRCGIVWNSYIYEEIHEDSNLKICHNK